MSILINTQSLDVEGLKSVFAFMQFSSKNTQKNSTWRKKNMPFYLILTQNEVKNSWDEGKNDSPSVNTDMSV